MPELQITLLDPDADADLAAWHATYDAALRVGRDPRAATIWSLVEMQAQLRDESERNWQQAWSGMVDGTVVAAGLVSGSNRHNLAQADVFVGTHPDQRGRGHGSALLAHLEDIAAERGRRLLDCEIAWGWDADPMGAGVPDVAWADRRGYRVGLVDVQRQVALPVDDGLLGRLTAETAPHQAGYTLRSFLGPVPDDLLQGWAELSSSLMTEAPMGEIQREAEVVDVVAYREGEALVARQGRSKVNTVALTSVGEVVAYTEIVLTRHEPDKAYQWGTLVRRDHRGHRLGMAVKLANLRLFQEHMRDQRLPVTRLITYNAEVNAHMIGVNEQLGFSPVERLGEVQKQL